MLYHDYKRKIMKIVAALKKMWRCRVALIIILSTVLALIVSFLATKGMVYGEDMGESTVIYGDSIDFEAKSLFSKTRYEYKSANGGDWSESVPRRAGKYKVRAVSNAAFGFSRYSDEMTFEIVPAEVTVSVSDKTIVYGEEFSLKADLYYSDTVSCTEYIYADISKEETGVTPLEKKVIIRDKNGEDVTSSYIIKAVESTVKFTKRDISVVAGSVEHTYNGESIKLEEYEIKGGSVADGDKIIAVFDASITEVGSVVNKPTLKIVTKDGIEVSLHYNIKLENGTITVNKRPVLISTNGAEIIYDGRDHKNEASVSQETPLVNGHKVVFADTEPIKNAGEIINFTDLSILDENDKDVAKNYVINYIGSQSLVIKKRPITVTTPDESWVYDGKDHESTIYKVSQETPAVSTDELSIVSFATIKNVGELSNEIDLAIANENGEDVTSNYDINYVFGRISVSQRPITIKTNGGVWEYDATEKTDTEIIFSKGKLVNDHQVMLNDWTRVKNVTEGTENSFDLDILDEEMNIVTDNYKITFDLGIFVITKRPVSIKSLGSTAIYDGLPLTCYDYEILLSPIDGHMVVPEFTGTITDAGATKNTFTVDIFDGAEDVTQNYEISYEYGILQVDKREITIISLDARREYDATPLTNETFVVRDGNEIPFHEIRVVERTEITDVGTAQNVLKVKIFEGEDEKTHNYNISYENAGELEVLKRPISIVASSDEKVYDGTPLRNREYTIGLSGIVEGHKERVEIEGSQTSAVDGNNSSENRIISVTVYDENRKDVTYNYDTTNRTNGTLTVYKRPIVIESATVERVYDDTTLWSNGYIVVDYEDTDASIRDNYAREDYGLAPDHTPTIYSDAQIIDVGSVKNTFRLLSIMDSKETGTDFMENKMFNYDVYLREGILTVTPRPIYIESASATDIYNGKNLTKESYSIVKYDNLSFEFKNQYNRGDYGLVAWHSIEASYTGAQLNVGSSDNYFDAIILSSGEDKSHNYEINLVNGTLTVNKRPITLTSFDESKVYDGTPIFNNTLPTVGGMGIVEGERLDAYFEEGIIDATEGKEPGKNKFTATVTKSSLEDSTDNYEITYVYGVFNISKRPITVSSQTASKKYDGLPLMSTEPGYNTYLDGEDIGLAYGQTIDVVITGSITFFNSAPVKNTIESVTITDQRGNSDALKNYNLTLAEGELFIEKRSITLGANYHEKVYDGYELVGSGLPVVGGDGLAWYEGNGDSIVAEYAGSITDVGECENSVADFKITHFSGADATDSYFVSEYIPNTLKITHRIITVSPAEKHAQTVYDGYEFTMRDVICSAGEMPDAHTIYPTFSEDSAITNAGTVVNDLVSVIIRNENDGGRDVTHNFIITLEDGELTVTKRKVIFESGSLSVIYDAEYHSLNEYSVIIESDSYPLADNEYLPVGEPLFSASIKNVGSVENLFTVNSIVKNVKGEEINTISNYEIVLRYGTLTVGKRVIHISSGSAEKIYDGSALTFEEIRVLDFGEIMFDKEYQESDYGLLPKHSLDIVFTGAQLNAGSSQNEFASSVFEGVENVSSNYEIVHITGELTVKPRPITLTSFGAEKIYDGEPISNNTLPTVSLGDIVLGEELSVIFDEGIIDAGNGKNVFTPIITKAGGEDSTDNYEIKCEYGDFVISKRAISIETGSASKKYDGYALNCFDYFYTTYLDGEGIGLANGQNIYVEITGSAIFYSEAPALNTVGEIIITDQRGNDDAAKNYDISVTEGTLTIEKREITLGANYHEKEYDGDPLVGFGAPIVGSDGLAYTDWVDVTYIGSQTEVGESANEIGEYKIMHESGEDATASYTVTDMASQLLVVTKRKITVTPDPDKSERVYDGTPFIMHDVILTQGTLPAGHKLVLEFSEDSVITDVGTVLNDLVSVEVKDMRYGDRDITDNYEITIEDSYLTVTKRTVVFLSGSLSVIYDGEYHSLEQYELIYRDGSYNLVDGDYVALGQPIFTESICDVGIVENIFDITSIKRMVDGEEIDVSHNYEILCDYGILEILPASLKIETGSADKIYDGEPLTNPEITVSGDTVNGHYIYAEAIGTITEAGTIKNNYILAIFATNGDDVSGLTYEELSAMYPEVTYNYTVDEEILGTLKVDKYALTIVSGSAQRPYIKGEYLICHEWNEQEVLSLDIFKSHTIRVNFYARIEKVGKTENIFIPHIFNSNGKDVTSSFDIEEVLGTLEVTLSDIIIISGSYYDEYDGKEHFEMTLELIEGCLYPDHYIDIDSAIFPNSVTNVSDGIVINTFDNLIIRDAEGNDVTYMYDGYLNYEYGLLEVIPFEVTVKAPSITKEYDGEWLRTPYEIEYNARLEKELNSDPNYVFTWEVGEAYGEILNGGSVASSVADLQIYLNGEPVEMSNFDITYVDGALTITQNFIEVMLFNVKVEYDGKAHYFGELSGRKDYHVLSGLPAGYTLELDLSSITITDVGTLTFDEVYEYFSKTSGLYTVYDPYGNDVTYKFGFDLVNKYNTGSITVTKRSVELTPSPVEEELSTMFGDVATPSNRVDVTQGTLVDGHYVDTSSIVINGEQKGIGSSASSIDISTVIILDGNGQDVTGNYNISVQNGIIEIVP